VNCLLDPVAYLQRAADRAALAGDVAQHVARKNSVYEATAYRSMLAIMSSQRAVGQQI
jgi:hypothetical protein